MKMLFPLCIQPDNSGIPCGNPRPPAHIQIPRITQMALAVVKFQQSADFAVPGVNQIFYRHLRRLPVIECDMGQRQTGIITVNKQNRYFPLHQLLQQREIGIGQAAFGSFHNDSCHIIPGCYILQNSTFPFQLVVGKRYLHRVASFKQRVFNPLYGPGKNIAVHIGGHHRYSRLILQGGRPAVTDIRAASPPPDHYPFFLQDTDSMSYGLPA